MFVIGHPRGEDGRVGQGGSRGGLVQRRDIHRSEGRWIRHRPRIYPLLTFYILGRISPRPSPPSPTGGSYEGEAARENEKEREYVRETGKERGGREREGGRGVRPFLRELYVLRTQASIYNVPLARVVSKKSITQQHTRVLHPISAHGPPNLARSPLFPRHGGSVEHSRPLSRRPSFLECHPLRLTYLFYTARTPCTTVPSLGMEFFIKPPSYSNGTEPSSISAECALK